MGTRIGLEEELAFVELLRPEVRGVLVAEHSDQEERDQADMIGFHTLIYKCRI